MTPAARYTQKRAEAVELIRQHAPPLLQDALIELLRPAIALQATRADDSQIPLGASKFGGAPNVPANFEWPMWNDKPLGFLAQINLEEVAPFDVEELLPKSGLLSFFISFDEEKQVWGDADQRQGWQTFFWKNQSLQCSEFPASGQPILPAISINPAVSWTLPFVSEEEVAVYFDEESVLFCGEEDNLDYMEFYDDFCEKLSDSHRIGGWPSTLQDPMESQCQAEFEAYCELETPFIEVKPDTWRFIFQLDGQLYDDQWWPYAGIFTFWIQARDLQVKDFSQTWLMQQVT
jgi:uncharacterized protein YwqG